MLLDDNLQVVAINNLSEGYDFPAEVSFIIQEQNLSDYRDAADYLNLEDVDVVNLQHEYGIFGGPDGKHILNLLSYLNKPVVTTLHTVLEDPTQGQRETLEGILSLSSIVVVLADRAVSLLKSVYGLSENRICMIPHGAPDVPFLDTSYYKDKIQADDRDVLLTFGLLSPSKGIEFVLEALPAIIERFPEVLYVVLGATHPNVKREAGEIYRIGLEQKVVDLGLEQHVVFHNHYVTLERLVQFLFATDIYITPYLSQEQIVSGTLAYAFACGKAIISTPYYYAQELLDQERGLLVPFQNSSAIAEAVIDFLTHENKMNHIRKKAYQEGRQMVWKEVAARYDEVFEKAVNEYGRRKASLQTQQKIGSRRSLPKVKLDHLILLTDNTGICQHALYRTPNRFDGYTTDDNARALMVAVMEWSVTHEEFIIDLIHTYLAFINYALDPEQSRFHNFMSYQREWLDKEGSEDCHGRVLWCLGFTISETPSDAILSLANQLFKNSLKTTDQFSSPRSWAYSILGCLYYLEKFGGDTETKNVVLHLSLRLFNQYKENRDKEWHWFEPMVTYANARLCHALIAAGTYLNDPDYIEQGLESLRWLIRLQTNPETRYLSLVGNAGWYKKGGHRAHFDQQPLDALCLLEACQQAYETTGQARWKTEVERSFNWFLGRNDKNECLADFRMGGCFDGLQRGGVNLNQGAESTLSWLAAQQWMVRFAHKASLSGETTAGVSKNGKV
jgi:glycosyltransferase involved in cell wall biosynthesis